MEIHYIVREEHAKLFCAIMNLAHFYVWNFFHEQFGIAEFPWQRAFFSDITIRHCVCKEAYESLETLSNPEGKNEPLGEKVTIKTLLDEEIFEKLYEHKLQSV